MKRGALAIAMLLLLLPLASAHTEHDIEASAGGYDVEFSTIPAEAIAGEPVTLQLEVSDNGKPVVEENVQVEILRVKYPVQMTAPGLYTHTYTFQQFGHNEFQYIFPDRNIDIGVDVGVPEAGNNFGIATLMLVLLTIIAFGVLVMGKRMSAKPALLYGGITIIIILLGYSIFAYKASPAVQGCMLQVGDEFVIHCHQNVHVNICGEEKGFDWEIGSLNEGAHTHKGDHRIHWHPGGTVKDPAALQTLRNMFTDFGLELTEASVADPETGAIYRAGEDGCVTGEPASLQVYRTPEGRGERTAMQNFLDAPLEDEERIDIVYGSGEQMMAAEEHMEDKHMPNETDEHSSGKHGHLNTFGPGERPHFHTIDLDTFAVVQDIARNPADVPPPTNRIAPTTVSIMLEAKEVISEIAPGITYNYWTFNETVPGPFLRVLQGDTVELTLANHISSSHNHSVDLHAVTGPGGGATVLQVPAGESKTLRFKALNPGLYVYHCATPNVPMHMANGMYGLILVEPRGGLPSVDKEFYVMQGELYTKGAIGETGFQEFDANKMLAEQPDYVLFNGRVKGLADHPLHVKTGENVRLYVGNGGVSLSSSFHVIGEIFDRVYEEAATNNAAENVQTTLVPAGGAAITEFDMNVPGTYVLVDHALARLDKGAWGLLVAEGKEDSEIYEAGK